MIVKKTCKNRLTALISTAKRYSQASPDIMIGNGLRVHAKLLEYMVVVSAKVLRLCSAGICREALRVKLVWKGFRWRGRAVGRGGILEVARRDAGWGAANCNCVVGGRCAYED